MAILPFRTSIFASAIYIYGNNRFTARDGFTGIPAEYVAPVMQYAATKYTVAPYATSANRTQQLNVALQNGWINQQEYDSTVALIV